MYYFVALGIILFSGKPAKAPALPARSPFQSIPQSNLPFNNSDLSVTLSFVLTNLSTVAALVCCIWSFFHSLLIS
ncbi:hypothetical protein F5Y03DRAFT_128471 [Xylaria venustula]|nr:hypothetical protein F5Y03DRAFT_128471 [Xylaria venustula]